MIDLDVGDKLLCVHNLDIMPPTNHFIKNNIYTVTKIKPIYNSMFFQLDNITIDLFEPDFLRHFVKLNPQMIKYLRLFE